MKAPVWILRETALALHEQTLAEFTEHAAAGLASIFQRR